MNDEQQIDQTRPSLLVPMNIEALVVGNLSVEGVNLKPDFRGVNFNQFLGQQLGPEPFTPTPNLYDKPGIHLHWALPDGLAHGVAGDNDAGPEFPLIPNRWLIIRFWDRGGKDQEPDLMFKAWIVESDTTTDNEDATTWLSSRSQSPDNGQVECVFVGKQFEFTQWPGKTSAPSVEIRAIGYGNPAFAAYYPACRGILGFHDKDLQDLQNVTLTYFVAGWYSDPSKDPLHQALMEKTFDNLDEFLGERKWTYPGFDDAFEKVKRAKDLESELKESQEMAERLKKSRAAIDAGVLDENIAKLKGERQELEPKVKTLQEKLPNQILCHGVISDIQWKGSDALYDSGVPRDKPFSVAVGNTAVEALAALFKTTLDEGLVRVLEAFQYDLLKALEKPGGQEIVNHKIHERAYRPLSRGIRWDLIQENEQSYSDVSEEKAPPVPGDIRMLLENLNDRQRIINRLNRDRDSLKSELYAAWYKSILNTEERYVSEASLNQQLTDLQKEIDSLTDQITASEDEKEKRPKGAEWDQLQEKLDASLPGYNLQPLDEPRFWRPNDPVLLLAGQAFRRSSRHGEDGRYRSDDRLLCRLSGQEMTRIKITIPYAKIEDVEFGPADLDLWCNPFAVPGKPPLPLEVVNLFRESLFLTLDTKRAHDIAVTAYERNEKGLAKDHAKEIEKLSEDLLDKYLKSVWEDARNPDIENPDLRREDQEAQTVWEFVGRFPSPVVMNRWEKNPWLPLFLQWQVHWEPSYSDAPQALGSWNLTDQGTAFEWKGKDPGKGEHEQVVYSGTTWLTPSAAFHFSDRLRQYNLTHDTPKLKEFQTAVSSMNLLCQSLGGLTDQLLMRKGRLELKPLEPATEERGPQISPIFEAVKDIEWLSPLTDSQFLPVRAGHLKLERLWVIDAFGQLLKLEDEDREKVFKPLRLDRLAGPDGYIGLEPRLAQPARLTIHWPPASRSDAVTDKDAPVGSDEEFNPVCGWILPNFLDSGLMIYDARGNALGTLQANQRKSWNQGAGARMEEIESFHWVDIPGSKDFFFGRPPKEISDPLGEKANPHLREFVKGLLSLAEGSGQAFGRLLDNMNDALSAAGGSGSNHNPNLALLIGKPLALVRASIRLELDGQAACAQGWEDVKKDPKDRTGGIEKVKFPIRLGDRRKWNDVWLGDDGLVGFFLNQDYSRFYPAYGLKGQEVRNDSYSEYEKVPEVSLAEPLDLTLLMDPSRGICATTGILPRKIFKLPYGDISDTLENKQIVFFTGPVVSPAAAAEIRMPQPSDIYGQWSWTHHPAVDVWGKADIADSAMIQGGFQEDPLQIAEGWLKLITAPLAIRVFTVKGKKPVKEEQKPEKEGDAPIPARFEVLPGEKVILSWAVTGAEEIELKEGDVSLFKYSHHPLPTQYSIKVDQNTSFTLIATGRANESPEVNQPPENTKIKTIDIGMNPKVT